MPGFRGAVATPDRYGKEHRAARKQWLALLSDLGTMPCVRCGRPLTADMDIHLDHHDDTVTYRGWSHAACNRSAGARLGAQRANAKKRTERVTPSRRW